MVLKELFIRLANVASGRTETGSLRHDRIFWSLRKGDIAVDCGANIGHYTALMARRGATVYAFEPNPDAFAVLAERFASHPHVHCFHQAVWVEETEVRLYLHENATADPVAWSTGSSLLPDKGNVNRETFVTVAAIDLDAFLRRLGHPVQLLKMDIEGAETKVLRRLIESGTTQSIGHVLVETHDDKFDELKAETDAMRNMIVARRLTNIDLGWK